MYINILVQQLFRHSLPFSSYLYRVRICSFLKGLNINVTKGAFSSELSITLNPSGSLILRSSLFCLISYERKVLWGSSEFPYRLFVWDLSSQSRIFHSYEDISITSEVLQIFTYARHLLPLSSEGSLVCHTYCDTGHPFIMVISEDPWHSHLLLSV